jgi:hypothetical protein
MSYGHANLCVDSKMEDDLKKMEYDLQKKIKMEDDPKKNGKPPIKKKWKTTLKKKKKKRQPQKKIMFSSFLLILRENLSCGWLSSLRFFCHDSSNED